jgi:hypothetical protein
LRFEDFPAKPKHIEIGKQLLCRLSDTFSVLVGFLLTCRSAKPRLLIIVATKRSRVHLKNKQSRQAKRIDFGVVGPSTGKRQRPRAMQQGSEAADVGVSRPLHDGSTIIVGRAATTKLTR